MTVWQTNKYVMIWFDSILYNFDQGTFSMYGSMAEHGLHHMKEDITYEAFVTKTCPSDVRSQGIISNDLPF